MRLCVNRKKPSKCYSVSTVISAIFLVSELIDSRLSQLPSQITLLMMVVDVAFHCVILAGT